jgi:hypothetical protein
MPVPDPLAGGPDWIAREFADLRREITELRSAQSAQATTIGKGGLRIKDGGSFQVRSASNVQVVYLGPDVNGVQYVAFRRNDGSTVLYTYSIVGGNQYWALTDKTTRILVSDDAASGVGLARPWLSVPMYPSFTQAASSTFSYPSVTVAQIATETTLWEGRIPLVSHPKIEVSGVWGQASGTNSSTYRLVVAGESHGTWPSTTIENSSKVFDVAAKIDQTNVPIQLRASATGTGAVAAGLFGLWLRQT